MAHPIETRILAAVGLVLAGCTPAQTPAPTELAADSPTKPVLTSDSGAAGDASSASVEAPADAGVAVAPPPETATVAPPAIDAGPPIDAPAVCAAYQKKAAADPKGPKTQKPTNEVMARVQPTDKAGTILVARQQGSTVVCRIVWAVNATQTTIPSPVSCCPPHVGPCPGGPPMTLVGSNTTIETAFLSADGKVQSSTLQAYQWTPDPPRAPYCGRRHEGFGLSAHDGPSEGARLAEMAELEAAAVHAFARLAGELEALGAPAALVLRVRRAQRDEVRHARKVARLARARGAKPRFPKRPRFEPRTHSAIATENVVEGCVFETFGAALASYHSGTEADPVLRALFAELAVDERAHAVLSWDVADWLDGALSPEERADVAAARRDAEARLVTEVPAGPERRLAEALFAS